jgi:putative glutamine amidotransferase
MTRPLIGITADLGAAAWRDRIREAALSPAAYSRAIERAGGTPVLLPPVLTGAAARLTAGLDGLMFCGGPDLAVRWHGPGSAGGLAGRPRDAFEIDLMRAAVAADVPFLAISRGLQVLNVALGGTLISPPADPGPQAAGPRAVAGREEPRPSPGEGWLTGYPVRISAGSKLSRALGATATVAATSHQMLDQLGRGLTAVAWTADEKVAAVEVAEHRFGIGVRWHPEEGDDIAIFEQLRIAAQASRELACPV